MIINVANGRDLHDVLAYVLWIDPEAIEIMMEPMGIDLSAGRQLCFFIGNDVVLISPTSRKGASYVVAHV